MTVMTFNSPIEFERRVEPFLIKSEALHNLPLGILQRLVQQQDYYDQEPVLGYIHERGDIQAVVIRTSPHMWVIATNHTPSDSVLEEMVRFFADNHHDVPGLIGAPETITRLADRWRELTGRPYHIAMQQKVYQLDAVGPYNRGNGFLKLAEAEDLALATRWLYAFGLEAGIDITEEYAQKVTEQNIKHKKLYFWVVDGQVVSMVGQARSTRNGTTINSVYTPDKWKRRGYATCAVASLSEKLLGEGYQFCSLYTDLSNSTSNNIYQKIGYYPIGDSLVVRFNGEDNTNT
ncbi:GNAT family N-acetyltransferase [Pontibacillus salicampi]|uniref:GNAT family N-acetyltransferase n=1 Tax=Pontibacillus salicampi TaxID=1449801 RepID=A0ABV6LPL2_9BACI